MSRNRLYSAERMAMTNSEKWFGIYVKLPIILTIILASECFIGGIVLAAILEEGWPIFALWGGGAVLCVLAYFFLKVVLCTRILNVCYLKSIMIDAEMGSLPQTSKIDDQKKHCPDCGKVVSENDITCTLCGCKLR